MASKTIAALLFVCTTLSAAPAQVRAGRGANPSAIQLLRTDLSNAIASMDQALPIYDGYRVKSMGKARQALMIADRVVGGRNVAIRPKITATDTVKSHDAHGRYDAAQITQSQTLMQTGLTELNNAMNELKVATNGILNKRGERCDTAIQAAINDATTAIGLHTAKTN